MAMYVKSILCCFFALFLAALSGSERRWQVITADGADIAFRNILIKKSLNGETVSCTVTRDNIAAALKKLADKKADIVLVKEFASDINYLPAELGCIQFDRTVFVALVNRENPLRKMKLSDLQNIWEGVYQTWSVFDKGNIFSIHRFGMRFDDSAYQYLKKDWQLKDGAPHFPLDSAQQTVFMVRANPNAIGLIAFDENLELEGTAMVQLLDNNGKNITYCMPHTAIFRKSDSEQVKKFLNIGKNK